MFVNLEWRIKDFSFLIVYNSYEKKYELDLEKTFSVLIPSHSQVLRTGIALK